MNESRRKFLTRSAALGTVLSVAPGVFLYQTANAKTSGNAASDKVRWGMLINTNLMHKADTEAAITACQKEHGIQTHQRPNTDSQWIRLLKIKTPNTQHVTNLAMMCQHCESPPCVDVCPTGASFKRADGIVLVDKHNCIGCRYCMIACPYSARTFVHEKTTEQLPTAPRGKGTVESCTLCVHRIDRDGENAVPACAEAVNKGKLAIIFGDLNNPSSDISNAIIKLGGTQIRADLGLNPGVRYIGL